MPTWEQISRIGLHPFGIHALHLQVQEAIENGRLAKGLVLRVAVVVTGTSDNVFVTAYSRDPLIVNLCQRACEKGSTWHFLGSVTMTARMDANNRPSMSLFMIIRKIVESESIEKILDDAVSVMKQKRTVIMDTLKLEDEKFFVGALYKAMYSGEVLVDYGTSGYDGAQAYNEFFVGWTAAEFLKLSEIMGKMDSTYFVRGPAVLRERLSLEKQRAIRDRGTVSQIENPSLGGFGLQNMDDPLAVAVLRDMEKTRWWDVLFTRFEAQITDIRNQAAALAEVGTAAHINAKLYDWNSKLKVLILNTLDRSEPITNQMTLGKRGSGGSAIRATFSATILSEQRNDPA
ncbi:hypothetical protein G6F57_012214 [Rhizopus arrhizus]|uniref:Uncharacterized protein n=1 Tax=Rhizopus oryzae TaxID=64495 RepID=A0A9P7BM78_RHIOR|nr:hypothetical protein G6F23_010614 [Rhizopus arrhizus]KAG1399612.1 hypothetical protein G6F58_011098 [Rhizopus delemar]KAG0754050.1 hypothetical protein G6F24_012649 [Rhizopus arrhizus]KAG0779647.1 hypothetical protein G6F22_010520 [Rhizopus arrhizus]KAG0781137.1 hypothetical protein G6F21_011799 [Rhizopus arrhizus]